MNPLIRGCQRLTLSRKTGTWTSPHWGRSTHNTSSKLTPVEKIIHDSVKAVGPVPFATYMQLCLSHPRHGYYMNSANKVFGPGGDFITSPEISQAFGELVAIWLLSQYSQHPLFTKDLALRLVELGPGRGTLMDDILRTISGLKLTSRQINVHLVETSQAMRALQEEKLTSSNRRNVKLHWHNSISELFPSTTEYTMLVAHEFFDALPIHVLQKAETGWHEVLVASTEKQTSNDSEQEHESGPSVTLRRVLESKPSATSTLLGLSSARFKDIPTGSTLEVSPTSFRIARKVGELLESGKVVDDQPSLGGCGLIIDYGGDKAYENSFRAFKEHKIVDVFHQPGNCDLTANVDFAYLREAMSDLVSTHGPVSQGSFLENMGLQLRLKGLLAAAQKEERKEQLKNAASRLVDRVGMGEEYKVLGITNKLAETMPPPWPFMHEDGTT